MTFSSDLIILQLLIWVMSCSSRCLVLFAVTDLVLDEVHRVIPTSVAVFAYEATLSISYRMSRHPFPTLQVVGQVCLGSIYGDHKGAPSIIESVIPVDLSKQAIRNRGPNIRFMFTQESWLDYHVMKWRTWRFNYTIISTIFTSSPWIAFPGHAWELSPR